MEKSLILSSQELSEFEKEIANLGVEDSITEEVSGQFKDDGQLSISEERAWMLHQQDPLSAAGPFTAAFRLTGKIDMTRLTQALKDLYQGDSSLNQIYQLDDEGELIKRHSDPQHINIDTQPLNTDELNTNELNTDEDVIHFLLARQSSPMDLENHPAIQFWLFPKSEQEVILGILGHHILLDDSAWKPIFTALSAFYHGVDLAKASDNVIPQPAQLSHEIMEQYWADKHPDGFTRTTLPTLFFKAGQALPTITYIGNQVRNTLPVQANRFGTRISTKKAETWAHAAQSSPFQALLTLFGFYLNQLLDCNAVDLVIPVVDHQSVTQLNQIASRSNVIPVTIPNQDRSITSAIEALRNDLLNGLAHNLPIEQIFSVTQTRRHAHPNILVTQVDDAADYLVLEGIDVRNLAIPPLSSDYDLTLAIQFGGDGHAKLELTTGNDLSPTIGAFLLEQFVAFIEKAESDSAQVLPSLFSTQSFSSAAMTAADNSQSQLADFHPQPMDAAKQALVDAILHEFKVILDQQDINEQDDFFEFGGHSLLATRVIGQLKTNHHIEVKIADFFNAPTALALADFAQYTDKPVAAVSASVDDTQEIIAPLSFLLETYMEIAEVGRNPIFNIPFALKFSTPIDEQVFQQAFLDTIVRHHSLRTLFLVEDDEEILQRIVPATTLKDYQWFFPSSTQGEHSASELLSLEANYSFDLTQQLPVRVRFFYDAQGQQYLSWLIYHSAFDEWSTGILIQDLFYAYGRRLTGKQPEWQQPAVQFHQYAIEQKRHPTTKQHLAYWQKYLGKVPPAKPLFYQATKQAEPSLEGAWVEFSFDQAVTAALNQRAKVNKSSMFHVVYCAISLAMYYLGAGKKILIGTSTYGRDDPRYQETVGLFTNVVMHYVEFAEELPVNSLITRVKDDIIESLPYSDVPFGLVEHTVAEPPLASLFDNLCEIYIQYHPKNALNNAIKLEDGQKVDFEMLEPERNIAKFGLHFEAYEDPNSAETPLRVVLAYRKSNYSHAQINLIQETTQAVFHALTEGAALPDITLRDIRKTLAQKLAQEEL
jgi:hypothetical protein